MTCSLSAPQTDTTEQQAALRAAYPGPPLSLLAPSRKPYPRVAYDSDLIMLSLSSFLSVLSSLIRSASGEPSLRLRDLVFVFAEYYFGGAPGDCVFRRDLGGVASRSLIFRVHFDLRAAGCRLDRGWIVASTAYRAILQPQDSCCAAPTDMPPHHLTLHLG